MHQHGVVVALAIMGLTACAKKDAGPPARVAGPGFSLLVPAGWRQAVTDVPAGGIALRANKRAEPGHFVGSLVVVPEPTGPKVDVTDPTVCARAAGEAAASTQGTVKSSQIIDGPMGKTCQFEVVGSEGRHAALGTMLATAKSRWLMLCNHDPRDTQVAQHCAAVLADFKLE